jgi:replication initiation protein RepC
MSESTSTRLPSPGAIRPSGMRRINLDMRARLDQADGFTGVPRGTAKPLRFLAAFQEAEPYLGLPAHAYKLVAWLVKQTQPQDWEEGSRPICWPSARRQAEFLGLSPARVKHLNRALFEAGILVIRDSVQGKRWGRRDPLSKRIIEAYGFDLAPLAVRYDEFIRIAATARVERERMRTLRRRATLARRAIRQAGEELAVQGFDAAEWQQLEKEVSELAAVCRAVERSDDLALAVTALERRQQQAEEWLRTLIRPVKTNPSGLENEPHQYTTTTLKNRQFIRGMRANGAPTFRRRSMRASCRTMRVSCSATCRMHICNSVSPAIMASLCAWGE